ncbi:MAG: hypothetical protein RIG61_03930 [Deltaproteobacteria bacterium]
MNPRRILASVLLVAIILPIMSCVFLRLHKVQNQLKSFEENFELNDEGGLTLVFLNPVLKSDDMVWLMKNGPYSVKEKEREELWTYVFEKQYLLSNDENGEYDIPVLMVMREDMVAEITFPERFLKNLSIPLLKRMFSSMGDADISKLKKSASSEFKGDNPDEIPKMENIVETLGQPYDTEQSDKSTKFTYLYYLKSDVPVSGSNDFEFKTEFVFSKDDKALQKATGTIRGLSMSLDFSRN